MNRKKDKDSLMS